MAAKRVSFTSSSSLREALTASKKDTRLWESSSDDCSRSREARTASNCFLLPPPAGGSATSDVLVAASTGVSALSQAPPTSEVLVAASTGSVLTVSMSSSIREVLTDRSSTGMLVCGDGVRTGLGLLWVSDCVRTGMGLVWVSDCMRTGIGVVWVSDCMRTGMGLVWVSDCVRTGMGLVWVSDCVRTGMGLVWVSDCVCTGMGLVWVSDCVHTGMGLVWVSTVWYWSSVQYVILGLLGGLMGREVSALGTAAATDVSDVCIWSSMEIHDTTSQAGYWRSGHYTYSRCIDTGSMNM